MITTDDVNNNGDHDRTLTSWWRASSWCFRDDDATDAEDEEQWRHHRCDLLLQSSLLTDVSPINNAIHYIAHVITTH